MADRTHILAPPAHAGRARLWRGDHGFALPAVVALLGLLGMLAGSATLYTRSGAADLVMLERTAEIDAAARGGLERAAQDIAQAVQNGRLSGRTRLVLPNAGADMGWTAETARINLNRAPRQLLVALFTSVGLEDAAAESLASRLVERRGGGAGAAITAALSHPAELVGLGLPSSLVAAVERRTTIYSGTARIDPRLASADVLRLVPGLGPAGLAELLASRNSGALPTSLTISGEAAPFFGTDMPRAFRVNLRVQLASGERGRFEAVMALFPDDSEPYRLLFWRPTSASTPDEETGR